MSLLMLLAAVYIIASAGEVWLFGWLGQYSIKLPILSAIIQNASWPLQLANYRYESSLLSQSRVITRHMLFSYGFLGCLAIFISMSKVIGLTSLPPILYVICANTEVVFQAILTKLILSKNITKLQLVSIVLVIIGFSITISHTLSVNARDIPFNQLCLGVIMSLLSRLCSSLNNVFAERLLGTDAKSHMGVLECTFTSTIFPFCILPFSLLIFPEYKLWSKLTSFNTSNTAIIFLLFLAVTLSKFADRFCKYAIVNNATTMFYAIVDSNMRVVAGIGSLLIFEKTFFISEIVGFIFVALSLFVSLIDLKQRELLNAQQQSNKFHLLMDESISGQLDLHFMNIAIADVDDDRIDSTSNKKEQTSDVDDIDYI